MRFAHRDGAALLRSRGDAARLLNDEAAHTINFTLLSMYLSIYATVFFCFQKSGVSMRRFFLPASANNEAMDTGSQS